MQLTIFVYVKKTDSSKQVKQEVNGTVILSPLVFLVLALPNLPERFTKDKHLSSATEKKRFEIDTGLLAGLS